jgi:prepilin-type N-terminal cleavage/methylation domain-containing protein
MNRRKNCGFSLVELIVTMGAIGIAATLSVIWIVHSRESQRRTSCAVKLRNIALGIHTFHDQFQRLPPSARYRTGYHLGEEGIELKTVAPGTVNGATRAPFSFLALIIPYIESNSLYGDNTPDFRNHEAFEGSNPKCAAAAVPLYICPSFGGSQVSTAPDYNPPPGTGRPAITNYKALGATTLACLQDSASVINRSLNGGTIHPYASYTFSTLMAPTQTVILTETKEEKYAAWWDGTTASIPGFHPGQGNVADDAGATPPHSQPALNIAASGAQMSFIAASQFGGQEDMRWGPSSEHPGLVNHAFGGTETRAVANDVDPAAYRAGISRRGEDNGALPSSCSR